MRITRLEMDNFGPFNGHNVDGFSPGLTVVHGENESGKSALRAFMRVILFGFPRARTQERAEYYYEPTLPGGAGGSLFINDASGEPYAVNRVEGVRGGPVTVSGTRDGGDDLLHELIGGVDDAFYQNVFSISLTQLQSFEALGRDEITERIYSAGLGMGNVSLRDVTRNLDDRISKYRRVRSGSLFDLEKELRTAREELEDQRRELAGYDRLSDRLRELQATSEKLDRQLNELRTDASHTERLLELRDPWLTRQRLQKEIAELPASNAIPVDGIERLDGRVRDIRDLESRIEDGDRRDRKRERRSSGLAVVDTFPSREADIRTATSSIAYYQEAVRDIPKRAAEAAEIESGVERDLAAIGPGWTGERVAAFNDAPGTIARIQSTADSRDEARRAASRAREDLERAAEDAEHAAEALKEAANRLAAAPPPPTESLEQLERKRDRLATLEGALAELETGRSQGTRPSATSPFTGIAITGVVLAIAGLLGIALAAFFGEVAGAVTGVLALVAGVALFFTSRSQSGSAEVQPQAAPDVADEVASITKELELPAPVSSRAVVEVRNAVGREIDRKRESSVLIAAEQAARNASETVEKRRGQAAEKVDSAARLFGEADESWDRLLAELDLHTHFDRDDALGAINNLGVLAGRTRQAAELRQRVSAMQAQNAETDRLLASILDAAGLDAPVPGAGLASLRELEQCWEEHVEALGQQQTLNRESDDWKDERTGLVSALETAKSDVANLLNASGCESADQFRDLATRTESRRRLERELDGLKTSAPDLFGPRADEIDSALEGTEPEGLQAGLAASEEKARLVGEERNAAMREEGEVRGSLRQMETEDRVACLHASIDELTERIQEEAREWSVLTVARSLLDQTRDEFQEQRQPSLLKAASGYFNKMTLGRYSGVRAVIGEERFEAIAADGRSVPPEQLSRGAAEQLWLSIRFALIDEYGSRSRLPVVLDDLLVNFDPQRARAACSAITALAERQQVIFLTCQPSAVSMLQEASAEHSGNGMSLIRLNGSDNPSVQDQETLSAERRERLEAHAES